MSETITAYLTDSDIEFLWSSFKIHYRFRKDNFRQLTYNKYGMGYYRKRDTNIDNILCRLIELINTIVKTPNKKSHWEFSILVKDINKIHSILENQDTSDSLSVFNKIQNIMLSNMRHTFKLNK
jgi:hypothetical protein